MNTSNSLISIASGLLCASWLSVPPADGETSLASVLQGDSNAGGATTISVVGTGLAVTGTTFSVSQGVALMPASATTSTDCNDNGVLDADEIAAASFKDTNENGILDTCEGLSVDRDTISLSAGGTQTLNVNAGGGAAGMLYWVIGSTQSGGAGTVVDYLHVPLDYDGWGGYLHYTLAHPNDLLLGNSRNFLDGSGQAQIYFNVEPGTDPMLVGTRVYHTALIFVLGPSGLQPFGVSNLVSATMVP